jgi:hypothetical protein
VVKKIHRWSEEFDLDSGPAGQNDRPMVNPEDRLMERKKAVIKDIRQKCLLTLLSLTNRYALTVTAPGMPAGTR